VNEPLERLGVLAAFLERTGGASAPPYDTLDVSLSVGDDQNDGLRILIAVLAAAGIAIAVYISKRRPIAIGDADTEANQPASTGTA